MKKVYLKVFGCQMNVRDSEVICGLLKTNKYKLTTKPEEAEVIIFNTCSVRKHAEDKVWSELGKFAKNKRRPFKNNAAKNISEAVRINNPVIGIVGCMAQNYKERIFERAPQVDFVVGPSDIHKIPEIIKSLAGKKGQFLKESDNFLFQRKIWETDGSIRPEDIYHTGFREDKEHAYVVISEGCSNFCSYCVVPYVRGQLRNRNYKDILKEIEEAVDNGIFKITLLGQNVNAFKFVVDFPQLLRMVNDIKGLNEFGFITSHPKDTTEDLFRVMADLDKLKKYLHLPVQSGSDRILKLMNRNYTRKFYLDLVDKYRKIVKNGSLTTDIIVGYPGETEDDFQDTRRLVEEIKFNAAYIFKYSVRMNTRAADLPDDVSLEEKQNRHRIILELQKRISKQKRC